ncbi:DNA cytosine methyltransferase [Aurantimonas coralicida]|uniref:DNA cytosine methyltransferase n=1 Tax=Aurantimonas coralicida TaxID=182270 RepID=UPI001E30C759|nr:DNA cytosine methyltransferase [Aurantimonas coralicida]MCD1645281.1 DNA cytosine methyltransferase [Aurantimonas coralicida]
MRYGSVCSGIECASAAFQPLGWTPAFFAEIEKFPSAVLAHRYGSNLPGEPLATNGVPNFGDVTGYEEWPDAAIDLLIGGTPCQSYSVAGLRKGLDDPRGDLTLTYAAVARKYRPRWLVWENVFGVLSDDGGRSFASLLALLSGRKVEVPKGGWKSAGIVEGYEGAYGLAWRVLDAQYIRVDGFGRAVPQRRRRVFVVGHSGGDWRRAAAVLLERESLSGNPAPRRKAGQDAARDAAVGFGGGRQSGPSDVAACLTAPVRRQDWEVETFVAEDTSRTLLAKDNDSHAYDLDTYVAHSLRAEGFDASEDGTGRGTPIVPVYAIQERAICENPDAGPDGVGVRGDGASYTLEARTVSQAVAFRVAGDGAAYEEGDRSAPLTTGTDPSAHLVAFDTAKNRGPCVKQRVMATIVAADGRRFVGENDCETPQTVCPRAEMPTGVGYELCKSICRQTGHAEINALKVAGEAARGATLYLEGHTYACEPCKSACEDAGVLEIIIGSPPAQTMAFSCKDYGADATDDVAPTLRAMGHVGSHANAGGQMAVAYGLRNDAAREGSAKTPSIDAEGKARLRDPGFNVYEEFSPTLDAGQPHSVATGWAVRRLTPLECERLMGLPDGYTAITYRGKPAADGPRYKALGNGFTVNSARWIARRIEMVDAIIAGRAAA